MEPFWKNRTRIAEATQSLEHLRWAMQTNLKLLDDYNSERFLAPKVLVWEITTTQAKDHAGRERLTRAMIDAAPADTDHDELFTSLGILLDWAFTPIKFKAASSGIYSRCYRDLPPLQRGVLSGSLIYSKKESFEINTETNSVTIKPGIIKKIEDLYSVRMTTERKKDFLREMETIIEAFNRLREKAPELGLRWPSFAGNAIKGEQDDRASINIESAATLYIQHLK